MHLKLYIFNSKTLTYENVTKSVLVICFISVLFISAIIFTIIQKQFNNAKLLNNEAKDIIINKEHEFTRERLKEYVTMLKIKFPKIVLAQAELETGGFTSKIFKENNNLFGMRLATSRQSTAQREQFNYAFYTSWKESVQDYMIYQARYLNKIQTEEQYLEYLSQSYAEDTSYANKLRRIMNTIKF